MDLNGDGHTDIVSGSYPGEMYLFAGDGKGGFAAGQKITGADGKVLKTGRATVMYVVDWESDGDLDILAGDIDGSVSLVRNESGDKTLKFGKVEKLSAAGVKIAAPGRNSGPIVTDWDGDGKPDLVVGCGDGSVQFFRNTAEKGEPVLAAGKTILPASSSWRASADEKGPKSPSGYRAKLAVVDWNGDGKKDLLVGDAISIVGEAPKLTGAQAKERDELQAKQTELQAKMQPFRQKFAKKYEGWYLRARKELGIETETPYREFLGKVKNEERQQLLVLVRKYQAEDPEWVEYDKLQKESREVWTKLRSYQPPRRTGGHVWFYARN